MKFLVFIVALCVGTYGCHHYYEFLLKDGLIPEILLKFGQLGYWFALLFPGVIGFLLGLFLINSWIVLRLILAVGLGTLVIIFGLFGPTLFCIFRGIGSCI